MGKVVRKKVIEDTQEFATCILMSFSFGKALCKDSRVFLIASTDLASIRAFTRIIEE